MTIPTPAVPFPEAMVGEWSFIDTSTAPGLFAYRQSQAMDLLELPDVGGGDLDAAQRREFLRNAVSFQKPLAALALFLGVVALEDFIRDLAARLVDMPPCQTHFPNLINLRSEKIQRSPEQMFKRLDKSPFSSLDPEDINKIFVDSLGVAPVPAQEFWHIRDLFLLRHSVAHHGAVVRHVDQPRFAHFIVTPGQLINPPPDFVRSELMYLYGLGRKIEKAIRSVVFGLFIEKAGRGWSKQPPREIIDLVEIFAYFGYIETTGVAVGYSEPGSELRRRQEEEENRIRASLLQRCVADLVHEHGG